MTQPKLARTTSGGRTYAWPPNPPYEFEVDSVTRINSGGVPKPAIPYWSAKAVAEFAYDQRKSWINLPRAAAIDLLKRAPWRSRDERADIGTAAHAAIEAYVAGRKLPELDKRAEGYALAGLSFLEEWEVEILHSEATVYSRKHGYAGTLDLIAKLPSFGATLIDFKTGKKPYPEVALQLAAYGHADFIGTPDGRELPLPAVRSGMVVILAADGSYRRHKVEIGEEPFSVFLHAKGTYEGMQQGHRWIGQPLPDPVEERAA